MSLSRPKILKKTENQDKLDMVMEFEIEAYELLHQIFDDKVPRVRLQAMQKFFDFTKILKYHLYPYDDDIENVDRFNV